MIPAPKILLILVLLFAFTVLVWTAHIILERARSAALVRIRLLKFSMAGLWLLPLACLWLRPVALRLKLPGVTTTMENIGSAAGAASFRPAGFSLSEIVVGIYLFVAGLLLLRIVSNYMTARRLLADANPVPGEEYWLSGNIDAPLAFGSKIYLPAAALSKRQTEMALAHERTHVLNGDPWWKIFSLMTRALLFFSPAIYSIHRRFESDMEIECDRLTMARTKASVAEYGGLLLDSAAAFPRHSVFAYMSDHQLKRRIHAMKYGSKKRPLLALTLTTILAASGYAVMATASAKADQAFKVQAELVVNGKPVAKPTIVTLEGEEATIETNSNEDILFIQLVAVEGAGGPQEVHLNLGMKYKGSQQSFEIKNEMLLESGVWTNILLSSVPYPDVRLRLMAQPEPRP